MRINQYIASKLNYSRRQADKLIIKKRIKIDGKIAVLGDKITEKNKVFLDNKILTDTKKLVYLIFNKPIGVVSSIAHKGQKGIKEILKYPIQVFPVGRLDKNSHGLMILTNDGRITEKLLHPRFFHEKEYVVKINQEINDDFIRQMENGVKIDGYKTKKCKIKKISLTKFKVILTEGKKRQIRKMCEVLGYKVLSLQRIRIMNIKLEKLKHGRYQELKGEKLKDFLRDIGI